MDFNTDGHSKCDQLQGGRLFRIIIAVFLQKSQGLHKPPLLNTRNRRLEMVPILIFNSKDKKTSNLSEQFGMYKIACISLCSRIIWICAVASNSRVRRRN